MSILNILYDFNNRKISQLNAFNLFNKFYPNSTYTDFKRWLLFRQDAHLICVDGTVNYKFALDTVHNEDWSNLQSQLDDIIISSRNFSQLKHGIQNVRLTQTQKTLPLIVLARILTRFINIQKQNKVYYIYETMTTEDILKHWV